MKIGFDFELDWENRVFRNEGEWKEFVSMLYESSPRQEPYQTPDEFPCLALHAGVSSESCRPDQVYFKFIYDFIELGE